MGIKKLPKMMAGFYELCLVSSCQIVLKIIPFSHAIIICFQILDNLIFPRKYIPSTSIIFPL